MKWLAWWLGPPSQERFAQKLIAEFRRTGNPRTLRYDPAEFQLVADDGAGIINLANIYREHCQLPRSQRSGHLRQLAQSLRQGDEEAPETFDEARPHLRPKIWSRASMENIELQGRLRGGKGLNTPTYPLGSHLVSALVYDLPTSMRSVSHEDLERWGVTYYEAMEAALENLEAASVAYSHIGDGFHTALSGDSYDSSRILLIDRIRQMPVTGATVAMVPQRDALYITGSDDETGLRILLDLTEQTLKEQPRPLAPLPLQLVDDAWEDWTVPKDHPLAARFQRLELQYLAEVYAEQAGLLEALHEQEGQAVYVAQFSGLENEQTGQLHSYCVWTQGVDTLLPRARHVVFVAGDEVVAQGPWERVQNVAGDLLEPRDDLYPIRYRVREFPTADQLAAIGNDPP